VISAKAYLIAAYLFIATGLTFRDCSIPPSFEPIARARMAISKELSQGSLPVPKYPESINKVQFTPPPPLGFKFASARRDQFNPGILVPADGSFSPVDYNMYVDDNLYTAAGAAHMRWAMRCSIAGIQEILGVNEPALCSCQPDLDKFFSHPVSHIRRQLGYVTDTRTMCVTIPEDKRQAFLQLLTKWGSTSWRRYSFTLSEAAELLGTYVYLCRVCHWGIFLFQNLYHAMAHTLSRIWNSPEFKKSIALRDQYSRHPTHSAKYRYFSRKVARTIYDSKSSTFITPSIRGEVDFIITVLSQPDVYQWESPIAHLIPWEPDGDIHQDACPRGGGGFSSDLDYWWMHSGVAPRSLFQNPTSPFRLVLSFQ